QSQKQSQKQNPGGNPPDPFFLLIIFFKAYKKKGACLNKPRKNVRWQSQKNSKSIRKPIDVPWNN
ncbi:MAG: hypothetical protein H7829_10665, partial [Magnetococcus sp. THC-1_WYH]